MFVRAVVLPHVAATLSGTQHSVNADRFCGRAAFSQNGTGSVSGSVSIPPGDVPDDASSGSDSNQACIPGPSSFAFDKNHDGMHGSFDGYSRCHDGKRVAADTVPPPAANDQAIYYQAFPCIRIIQPGEFSLGVHCDTAYGFAPTNVNFVVPLTWPTGSSRAVPVTQAIGLAPSPDAAKSSGDASSHAYAACKTEAATSSHQIQSNVITTYPPIGHSARVAGAAHVTVAAVAGKVGADAAALYIESAPGREDWHPVDVGPGHVRRFWGSQCLHWTSENTTPGTRVSLDFRVVPTMAYQAEVRMHFFIVHFVSTNFVFSRGARHGVPIRCLYKHDGILNTFSMCANQHAHDGILNFFHVYICTMVFNIFPCVICCICL